MARVAPEKAVGYCCHITNQTDNSINQGFSMSNRIYLIKKCKRCNAEFKARIDYVSKTGCCRACANRVAGETRKIHGENNNNSRIYVIWSMMKRRCNSPTEKEKINYQFVSVCEDWEEYIPFRNWALSNGYEENLTLDRKDCNGDYEPDNCRWVDTSTQNANKRITQKNKTGYIGVSFNARVQKYRSKLEFKRTVLFDRYYENKLKAAIDRDLFIISNNLPHTLNFKWFNQK